MKNLFTSALRSVVSWIRPVRRVQPEARVSPEQLREALREMLGDPATRRLVLGALVRPLPIGGGAFTNAEDVKPGTFGTSTDMSPLTYKMKAASLTFALAC